MTIAEPHSCDDMDVAVADARVAVLYRPRFRSHGLYHIVRNFPVQDQFWTDGTVEKAFNIIMYFCPWCGEALPGALHDKWYNVIRYGFKIGDFDSWQDDPRLPEEMLSDAWRRRRKIGVTSPVFDADWEVVTDHDGEILVGANDPKPGFDRPRGRSPHLCEIMAAEFDDVRDMFAYLPHVREYGVRVLDPAEPVDYQPIRIKPINYCFWCGDALPTPLREEWERRIAAEGLTPDDPDIPTNPPEKWRTDQWWRDAGL